MGIEEGLMSEALPWWLEEGGEAIWEMSSIAGSESLSESSAMRADWAIVELVRSQD